MSRGQVLFRGTWEEALRHADEIPAAAEVQVVEVAPAEELLPEEAFRRRIDDLAQKARDLDASEKPNPAATANSDPYLQALEEKYRKQGLRFE